MGAQQPYLYDAERRDSRSPEKPFDPKAITRASWEPTPKKKKQKGPFIAFNRHPDAHVVPTGRTSMFKPMSSTTKWWIKFMRYVQLFLRILEMIGGGCLLVLMILISNVDPLVSWIMRITPGVVAISCVYAVWHLIRPAGSRPPGSSAAYQMFAGVTDLAVIPLYAFGVISVVNHGKEWNLIIAASPELTEYLVQSEYFALICAGSLHVVSLCISTWLCLMFRRIANMPPDFNPLEDHLTSRVKQHKRNKSSVATSYTAVSDDSNRLDSPLESYRNSGAPYEDLSRPPSIPFMHTRTGSRDSFASKRDSRCDLPSRQYQITPGNSPRNSVAELKRLSTPRVAQRASYTEVPLHETGAASPSSSSSRPSSITIAPTPSPHQPTNASPTRIAKFTEAWYASESLINRTQEKQRALKAAERSRLSQSQSQQYEAVNQRYNFDDSDDDSDRENNDMMRPDDSDLEADDIPSSPIDVMGHLRPNPLRLNPTPQGQAQIVQGRDIASRQKTPFEPLSEVSHNARSVSGSQDIADEKASPARAPSFWRRSLIVPKSGGAGAGRNRDSSIQPDGDFYAKPYGELKPATPPVMLGGGAAKTGGNRQVSSGNDYGDLGSGNAGAGAGTWRRNVSGKIAEEGLGGNRYSRYSILNED
ncbi:hypothetical protein F5Y00DRAFT_239758 [Daldinia vernicosa]|uniref:uncharacterized protein n=1 Tax=Daldinia vernicosa TaxID=114800 RepID=UPI0020079BDF|nr:uncharacterized protein F5Y00DRAFT_239758 [Daldinia vernicosa]KAI0848100.1 hypothetical protein F5Y00DRAFT_239758 [Daldinia vernicosa]